jgi:hypothetical protein
MAAVVGKDTTTTKIMPILTELLKSDNAEVKLNVVQNLTQVSTVLG